MHRTGNWWRWRIPSLPAFRTRIRDREHATCSELAVIGIRGIPATYGGLETCAEHTTEYWSRKHLNVLVYCRKSHYAERPTVHGTVRLKYTRSIACKSMDTLSHTFISLVDLLWKERQIRLVHLYNAGNAIFLPLLKLFGRRVVVSCDGLEWKREKWGVAAKLCHRLGERMAVMFADRIIVDNQEVATYYARKYGKETSLIAYGARIIECNEERSAEVLARHRLKAKEYFIFVGRLVPEKCVHELIAAYEGLETSFPLVIIGDDVNKTAYRDELFARQNERVRFAGFVYGEEYEQLLVNSLMYVSASKVEGTSPSLLAAMGAKVCSLVNGIEENQVSTNGSVCLFKKNDYGDLRRKWQQLIEDPERAAAVAQNGYRYVVDHYKWDAIAERYLTVFRETI